MSAAAALASADGVAIMVNNHGPRHATDAVMRTLTRGETVPPRRYHLRTECIASSRAADQHRISHP
jgi:hypothetical protein